MVESWVHQVDKTTWNKFSFYINIMLFIVVAIATIFLILDSYGAGKIAASGTSGDLLSIAWISIVRDIAFFSVALALIFFQFFRNLRVIILRSW